MRRKLLWLIVLSGLALLQMPNLSACDGSRRPACGRSVWLAKWVEEVIVHPGDGVAIEVKVGLLPYATWNPHPNCAQPSSASLMLRLECEPDNGGPVVQVGPMAVPVAVPMDVGAQPVLTGLGATPELGGAYCFEIPAGLLPAGVNYVCTVVGDYSVTFTGGLGGAGSGTITGTGDAEVCIVEPSPLDSSKPRLLMKRLEHASGSSFLRCRKGDQPTTHYLIANNDDEESVSLLFETWSSQVARRPTGGTDEDTFAISSDKKNTDNFPMRFVTDLAANGLVPVDSIMDKTDQRIERQLILGPGELRVVEVAMRSHGMCSNGSCCEVLAKVTGNFSGGSPALGCAGTAYLVDGVSPKSPLCDYSVTLRSSPNTDTRWKRPEFDHDHMRRTHFDNSEPIAGATIAVSGSNLDSPWPDSLADFIRSEEALTSLRVQLDGYRQSTGFARDRNKITVVNLPADDFAFSLPHLAVGNKGSTLKVKYDATGDAMNVVDATKGKSLFSGTLAQLVGNPPLGLWVDPLTSVDVQKEGPGDAPWLGCYPSFLGGLLPAGIDPPNSEIEVYDRRDLGGVAWSASSDSPAAVVVSPTGLPGEPVVIDWNPTPLPTLPDVEIGAIAITSPGALNSHSVPYVGRVEVTPSSPWTLMITSLHGDLFPTSAKPKDRLELSGLLQVEKGLNLKKLPVYVELGPSVFSFQLDKKGKGKLSKDQGKGTFEVRPEKLGGVVQKGDAEFELKLKKRRIANMLKDYGIFPETLPLEGVTIGLQLRIYFPNPTTIHTATIPLLVTGNESELTLDLVE